MIRFKRVYTQIRLRLNLRAQKSQLTQKGMMCNCLSPWRMEKYLNLKQLQDYPNLSIRREVQKNKCFKIEYQTSSARETLSFRQNLRNLLRLKKLNILGHGTTTHVVMKIEKQNLCLTEKDSLKSTTVLEDVV